MATVTGYTAEKMQEINDTNVIDGDVVGDNLILHPRNAPDIDAGNVRGPKGDKGDVGLQGPIGDTGPQGIQGQTGPIGKLVARSETTVGGTQSVETTVASFVVPAAFKIGDRLLFKHFGSVQGIGGYVNATIFKFKIDGVIIGQYSTSPTAVDATRKVAWDTEWLLYQETATTVWARGLHIAGTLSSTVDTGSDTDTRTGNYSPIVMLANPIVVLAGKTISVTISPIYAQYQYLCWARGFQAEHYLS